MSPKNTKSVTLPPKGAIIKPDAKVIVSILIEEDRKKWPSGWNTAAALASTVNGIKQDASEFVQMTQQYLKKGTDLAPIVFYAREQYKAVNVGKTDMDFIREYFDSTCPAEQKNAVRNSAYQAIITNLMRLARKMIDGEKERLIRLRHANEHRGLIEAGTKEVLETGAITPETKAKIGASNASWGLPIPEALKPVLAVNAPPLAPAALKDQKLAAKLNNDLAEAITTTEKYVAEPPKDTNVAKAGKTKDPSATALAEAKLALLKMPGADAVTVNTVCNALLKTLWEVLGRDSKSADGIIKEADFKVSEKITKVA